MRLLEIFDISTGAFMDATTLNDDFVIDFDYLSPQPMIVPCNKVLNVSTRNVVRIREGNETLYEGWVSSIESDTKKSTIWVSPLVLLVDVISVQNATYSDWARQINQQLWYDFRQTTPSLYSLPLDTDSTLPYTNWGGVTKPYEAILETDLNCIKLARQTYGLYMNWKLDLENHKVLYGFMTKPATRTIEADLSNIIKRDITISTRQGYNIAQIWFPQSEGSSSYSHYDAVVIGGEIIAGGSRKNEIAEPRIVAEQKDYAWKQKVDTEGYSVVSNEHITMLKVSSDNYNIRLTVRRDDKIIEPNTLAIGTPCTVMHGGTAYSTYLTGKRIEGDLITLTFGYIRTALTKRVITGE